MARLAPSSASAPAERGYRVELPRPCDAIGGVLRGAYARDVSLPDDMAMLLHKLSQPATSRDRDRKP